MNKLAEAQQWESPFHSPFTTRNSHFLFLPRRFLTSTLSQNNKNIAIWGGFLTVSLVIYFLVSSGDFSFLLVSIS
jgi:hypothetical protein